MRYQETWIRGCPTADKFQRACAPRYEVIRERLGAQGLVETRDFWAVA